MPRGGARQGAGRKKGAAGKRSRETANKLAAEAATGAKKLPLEMMVEAAQQLWDASVGADGRIVDRKLAIVAATLAKDAAPYIHPRLTSVEANVKHDLSRLSDADLDAKLATLLAGGVGGAVAGAGETDEAPPRAH